MTIGGGWPSIRYALRVAREVGAARLLRTVFSRNACKTCGLGMGGQAGGMRDEAGHFPSICKKSLQAQLTDIQPGIPEDFYGQVSIRTLGAWPGRDLERLGRLNHPLYKRRGDAHYTPITWETALSRVIARLRVAAPRRTFFGRAKS